MTKRAKSRKSAASPARGPTTAGASLPFDGGVGERADARLLGSALRQRFPMRPEAAAALATKVLRRALETDSDRTLAALARVVAQFASINQKDELAQIAPDGSVNVTVINGLYAAMEAVRNDPAYVEHLYAAARQSGGESGPDGYDP